MKLGSVDYLLARISSGMPSILKEFGDVETQLIDKRLSRVSLDNPVFICGLARSGTTLVLNLISQLEGVATHRYRDFPFVFVPYAWHRFQDYFSSEDAPYERPHGDRIWITRESPDAFEEPIWQHFFPQAHDPAGHHVLSGENRNTDFDTFFSDHLKKVLLIRGGQRYVSKGNYNVSRIAYLARLFPDAFFVVPVRHPASHVHSLVRQHRRFTDYARKDPRVPKYLQAAGHYEFGPQRQPVNYRDGIADDILQAWSKSDDYTGYALLWRETYRYVQQLLNPDAHPVAARIKVVRYEDLCEHPAETVDDLLSFVNLDSRDGQLTEKMQNISASRIGEQERGSIPFDAIWSITERVAQRFGYDCERVSHEQC